MMNEWMPRADNLRVLSLREARDSWIPGWATVVFSIIHKERLVPAVPDHATHRIWWLDETSSPSPE